jgi:hypothetical protein
LAALQQLEPLPTESGHLYASWLLKGFMVPLAALKQAMLF